MRDALIVLDLLLPDGVRILTVYLEPEEYNLLHPPSAALLQTQTAPLQTDSGQVMTSPQHSNVSQNAVSSHKTSTDQETISPEGTNIKRTVPDQPNSSEILSTPHSDPDNDQLTEDPHISDISIQSQDTKATNNSEVSEIQEERSESTLNGNCSPNSSSVETERAVEQLVHDKDDLSPLTLENEGERPVKDSGWPEGDRTERRTLQNDVGSETTHSCHTGGGDVDTVFFNYDGVSVDAGEKDVKCSNLAFVNNHLGEGDVVTAVDNKDINSEDAAITMTTCITSELALETEGHLRSNGTCQSPCRENETRDETNDVDAKKISKSDNTCVDAVPTEIACRNPNSSHTDYSTQQTNIPSPLVLQTVNSVHRSAHSQRKQFGAVSPSSTSSDSARVFTFSRSTSQEEPSTPSTPGSVNQDSATLFRNVRKFAAQGNAVIEDIKVTPNDHVQSAEESESETGEQTSKVYTTERGLDSKLRVASYENSSESCAMDYEIVEVHAEINAVENGDHKDDVNLSGEQLEEDTVKSQPSDRKDLTVIVKVALVNGQPVVDDADAEIHVDNVIDQSGLSSKELDTETRTASAFKDQESSQTEIPDANVPDVSTELDISALLQETNRPDALVEQSDFAAASLQIKPGLQSNSASKTVLPAVPIPSSPSHSASDDASRRSRTRTNTLTASDETFDVESTAESTLVKTDLYIQGNSDMLLMLFMEDDTSVDTKLMKNLVRVQS